MSVFVMCSATILFFSDIDLRMKAEPKSADARSGNLRCLQLATGTPS